MKDNCKKIINELTTYLDGGLDGSTRHDLEEHLSRCKNCRLIIDTTRQTVQIFCNSEPVPLPVDVRERLHAALRARFRRDLRPI